MIFPFIHKIKIECPENMERKDFIDKMTSYFHNQNGSLMKVDKNEYKVDIPSHAAVEIRDSFKFKFEKDKILFCFNYFPYWLLAFVIASLLVMAGNMDLSLGVLVFKFFSIFFILRVIANIIFAKRLVGILLSSKSEETKFEKLLFFLFGKLQLLVAIVLSYFITRI